MNIEGTLENFKKRVDVTNRADLLCLACKKIGTSDMGSIYAVHYAFNEQFPTRIQIQSALNRDFGSNCVIDPTSVLGGQFSISSKVYAKYPLEEFDRPKIYISNLTKILNEKPEAKYVESGDIVRFFNASVMEGQVVGFEGPNFSIRVGADILSVAGDSIVDVKKSPKFFPVDEAAYDYYIQLYPIDFVKKLTDNNPKHFLHPEKLTGKGK
jgi:hypothetical protein